MDGRCARCFVRRLFCGESRTFFFKKGSGLNGGDFNPKCSLRSHSKAMREWSTIEKKNYAFMLSSMLTML